MPTDTRTVEQIVLPIAEREGPCPEQPSPTLEFPHWSKCSGECHGTGQVARFPMLREPCPPDTYLRTGSRCRLERRKYEVNRQYSERYTEQDWLNHCWCQGRGYLLVATERALLEAGKPYGIKLEWVELGSDGPETWLATAWARHPRRRVFGQSSLLDDEIPDPRKALALALEAALQQEVHDAG